MRDKWSSRSTFILAAIGSAVGLGNAWRFPGLAAKHGGGAFLLVYLAAMLIIGIPLLAAEIAIGRKIRSGAAGSMGAVNRKAEGIGWMCVSNGFFISIYYAVVFGWVILMFIESWKFGGLTGDTAAASQLWANEIKTTGTTTGFDTISLPVVGCVLIAWIAVWWCIRNGTTSVGKVVKYTVSLPVICLLILAVRGFTMPGAMAGVAKLFIPDWTSMGDPALWIDAIGQVFYSLSTAMAIMFAYGSFLDDKSNIATDTFIIAFADMIISVLAGIVMFTTMAGTGMLDKMTASGISTAFIVYPQAIVSLTDVPWINAAFAYVFYFCLITLAIDSEFSIVEGVSTAVSDKFGLKRSRTTIVLCLIGLTLGLVFTTGAGLGILDIMDNFINSYTLVLTGALESFAIGWLFKTSFALKEVNRNTTGFKMPGWLFYSSIKVVTPIVLLGLFGWNMYSLITSGGIYGAADGYSLGANIAFGWAIMFLSIISGIVIRLISAGREKKGKFVQKLEWDNESSAEEKAE